MLQTISETSIAGSGGTATHRRGSGRETRGVAAHAGGTGDLEIAVLQVAISMRGLPPRAVWRPLDQNERGVRLETLLVLWRTGCRNVMDEGLAADIAYRRPDVVSALRRCSAPPLARQPFPDAV